jgi:hypothetical protein
MDAAVKTRTLVLLWILSVTAPMWADDRLILDDGPGILRDPAVLSCFTHLLSESGYGARNSERAAFLVAQKDRSIQCLDWPATQEFREARWSGPVPAGVVALAHTHPPSFPYPSDQDVEEAKRLGMPIFVLTPKIVSVVHVTGRRETLAYRAEWIRGAPEAAVPAFHIESRRNRP